MADWYFYLLLSAAVAGMPLLFHGDRGPERRLLLVAVRVVVDGAIAALGQPPLPCAALAVRRPARGGRELRLRHLCHAASGHTQQPEVTRLRLPRPPKALIVIVAAGFVLRLAGASTRRVNRRGYMIRFCTGR